MKQLLIIVADTNDADYVTSQHYLHPSDIKRAKGIVAKLHKNGYNWVTHEYSSEELPETMYKGILHKSDIEWFGDLVPQGENGVHSITSIKILDVVASEKLL